MAQHKWAKEIHAWADGAEIEMWYGDRWEQVYHAPDWFEHEEYRIKPQPKEPQYLYVYKEYGQVNEFRTTKIEEPNGIEYIGKLELKRD